MDFIDLRRQIIKKDFEKMNDMQFEAVTTVDGPLLILAGAGSGKTTVLVNRIANLVKFGNAYKSTFVPTVSDEDLKAGEQYLKGESDFLPRGVFSVYAPKPWEILAITFTNKAANELKERIALRLGDAADDIWAGTFHSVCGKMLRKYAELIGYTSSFTIYDTDDQRRLMKDIMKQNNIDEKLVPHKSVLNAISRAKDSLKSPADLKAESEGNLRLQVIADLYRVYQKRLIDANAMDFDDMIYNTVKLLEGHEDVLEYYSNRFKYIMVDEYQDTNHAQYVLVSLLASKHNNICVVGDDDQSIYRFRGATIENILSFEDEFSNAKVIRLEQNYRSTTNILNAANAVISNNKGRKGKTLWTDNGDGSKIMLHTAVDEREEAKYVADSILENVRGGARFSDHAILYRMNAQSNALENVFARSGISYRVVGGFRFFERKEIKDVLAYLCVINNNSDDLRLKRIINEPKRGIGDTTVNNAAQIAGELGVSLFEVFKHADEFAQISRAAAKLKEFCAIIEGLSELSETATLHELFSEMLEKTGYKSALIAEGEEARERIENVEEFATNIMQYESENEDATLSGFLEEIALVTDLDSMDADEDKVILMTVHSAKGLEFSNVYLIGWEEGIFPGNQSIYGGEEEIEEERRLAYVAITRAKKNLHITNAYTRMIFGSTNRNMPSRFVRELPDSVCEISSQVKINSFLTQGVSRSVEQRSSFAGSGYSARSSYNTSTFADRKPQSSERVSYTVGQTVEHKTFGKGVITGVTPMGNDSMLQIDFESVGSKKIMAQYANLKII